MQSPETLPHPHSHTDPDLSGLEAQLAEWRAEQARIAGRVVVAPDPPPPPLPSSAGGGRFFAEVPRRGGGDGDGDDNALYGGVDVSFGDGDDAVAVYVVLRRRRSQEKEKKEGRRRGAGAGIKTITTKMTKPNTNSNIWIRNKTRVQFSKTVSSQTRRYRRCFVFCIRPGKNLNYAANSVCSIQTGSRTTNYLYLLHLCQWNQFERGSPKSRRTDTHSVN